MKTNEIYQSVTDTIIQLLETQLEKWDRPWVAFGNADNDYARNAISGKYYRGLNQFLLSFSLTDKDYPKNTWLTFNQVKEKQGEVRKGEKATPIVFFKKIFMDKDKKYHSPEKASSYSKAEAEAMGLESVPLLRLYYVFNIAQTEGLDPKFYEVNPAAPLQEFEKDERAEQLILGTGADIEFVQGNHAYYNPVTDKIRLPLREQFKGTEPLYATALHEVAHWTGHESRLNRDLSGSFGDDAYSKEELIGELTAAFCCASLGFSKTISNNAAYIKHWLGILKADNKAVVRASYQAQKAADYIIGGGKLPSYDND
jgi:antirestriction protein ArdC